MSVKIRLRRMGTRGKPFYRVVVADSRAARNGRFIDQLGYYDPRTDPVTIKIDEEKALLWLGRGAQPSDTAAALLKKQSIIKPVTLPKEAPAEEVLEPAAEETKAKKKTPTRTRKKTAEELVTETAAETDAAAPEAEAPEVIAESETAGEEQPSEEQG